MKYSRKTFITRSAMAAAALSIPLMDAFANPLSQPVTKGFDLKIMAPFWGFEGTITAFCKKAKQDGYDGIEIIWLTDNKQQDELFSALKNYDLLAGFLCRGDEADPLSNLNTFKNELSAAINNPHQPPLYINVHSGKDYFSHEDNQKFIDHTLEIEKQSGIPIYHETHRSRMLYAAHVAHHFLKANKDLRITLDISHWCNVAESLLEDQEEAVALALSQTAHIHSRVGHPEGPQIGDPRAPEWKDAVDAHFGWWDKVVALKKQKGELLTMLTEFGPPTYMPTIPFTNKPVANQWEVNKYMKEIWRKRYMV